MHLAGYDLRNIHAGYAASRPALKTGPYHNVRLRSGALFVQFLEEHGLVVPPPKPPTPVERWPVLGEFRDWMRRNRGVMDSSLDTYQEILVHLLQALGDGPDAYTAQAVREFVLARASKNGLVRARMIVTATRAFLRFFVATGRCPACAVMMPFRTLQAGNWHPCLTSSMTAISRGSLRLAMARNDCVIVWSSYSSFGLGCAAARLQNSSSSISIGSTAALRSSAASHAGGMAASPTGRRRRAAGLSGKRAARSGDIARVHNSAKPIRPVSRFAVNRLVQAALDRAGIQSVRRGSHLLRHSAATAMLRHGVNLAGVGAVLRHRSLNTTMQYAKVDFDLLREIAQPWAGEAAC